VNKVAADTDDEEERDFDEGNFDEEEVTEDSESGEFEGVSEDLDIVSVGREDADEDCEVSGMWNDVTSVRNSKDFWAVPFDQ